MTNLIVARWRDWDSKSLEHLALQEGADQIVADSAIITLTADQAFAARYHIVCDHEWRLKKAQIAQIGGDAIQLASDGVGNWVDGSATPMPQLRGAIDIDISITPFTNTLPIRRLNLRVGERAEISVVYLQLPGMKVTTDRQRYTCLEAGESYRYESVDSDFTRDIEVDEHGLVVTYPGLFRRVL